MSRTKAILLGISLIQLIFPSSITAFQGPILVSPSNNSDVDNSTLTWQKPEAQLSTTNPYRVQIDNNSDFTSPEKNTYVSNQTYSPQLQNGTWFWRVYFRDSNTEQSDWSETWSFNLNPTTQTSPEPSPSSPTPSASPQPSPSVNTNESNINPSPSPSPSIQPTASPTQNQFNVAAIPEQIDSTQNFIVQISLTGLKNQQTYYLKGAFKQADSSNYFGKTNVSGTWVKNGSSYSSQFPIQTNTVGSWSGNLEIMPDSEDSGYTGQDEYIFKIARYDNSGNGPTWSSEFNVYITGNSTGSNTTITTSSPTPKPSILPSSSNIPASIPSNKSVINPLITDPEELKIASIAGVSTESAKFHESSQSAKPFHNYPNFFNYFTTSGLLLLISSGLIGYRTYKINSK